MMSRAVDALLAAAATIAAVLGLTTLTENATWLGHAIWACLVVAAAGVLLRRLTSVRLLVLFGQLVVTGWAVVAMFAADRLWYGLPGPDAWNRVVELAAECAAVMQRYAAPIPTTEGVQFVLVAAVAGLAILVDFLAVTEEMPGVAGLPLLAAFLTAAANGGSSLSPWFFVVAAAMWLVLVARQGRDRVQRWSTTVASLRTPVAQTDVESQVMWGFGNVARQLGFAAVVAAVVLPAVVPHLPTRYILDGLGRNDGSIGREGRVGFNSTVDLTRSLQSGDDNIVMTYRTSAPTAPPLRVVVASNYVGGEWAPRPVGAQTQQLTQSRVISSEVPVTDRQLQVESNYLSPPNVASVSPVVATDFGGAQWYADPSTGDLYARARPDSYSLTYREVDATAEQLAAGIPGASTGRGDPEVQLSSTVDAGIAAQLTALTDTVTEGTTSTYAAAAAIQKWLRSDGGFNYSLQLPQSVLDDNGQPIGDPILKFLKSKTGYCVQFASTMVMMARAKGIPARMAIGFLPRHPAGRPVHGAVIRRTCVARAVLPWRWVAPVRAHPGGPHRRRTDLHDPARDPAARGDDRAHHRKRSHRVGDEHRPRPRCARGRRAGHGRHQLGHRPRPHLAGRTLAPAARRDHPRPARQPGPAADGVPRQPATSLPSRHPQRAGRGPVGRAGVPARRPRRGPTQRRRHPARLAPALCPRGLPRHPAPTRPSATSSPPSNGRATPDPADPRPSWPPTSAP